MSLWNADQETTATASRAATVRRWLSPPARSGESHLPTTVGADGAAVRRVDWEAVRLPDTATLMEFCQVLAVNAEYVLFGEGPPYRGQSRDKAELEADLAAELSRRLGERGHAVGKFLPIDARAVIAKAEEECAREVSALNEFDRAYDALAELGRALPHNPPSDSERATVRAREQLWSILIKLNGASPTHYVRPRTIYGIGEVSLPLLQVTGVGKVENP